jgi:hypothetical protein
LCCSIFCCRSIFSCHRTVSGLRLPLRFGFLRCLPRFCDFRDFSVPPEVSVSGLDFPARIGAAYFAFSPAPDFRYCSTGPRAPGTSLTVLSCRRFSCRPLLGFGHTARWLSVSFARCSLRSCGKARPCAEFLRVFVGSLCPAASSARLFSSPVPTQDLIFVAGLRFLVVACEQSAQR